MIVLEYPISRPFPWRHFTLVTLLLFSLLVITATLLNVLAVGYQTQSFYADKWNPPVDGSWLRFVPWKSNKCEPTRMRVRDLFATEVGLFQYDIHTLGTMKEGSTEWESVPAIPYEGEPFESCIVSRMLVTAVRPDRTIHTQTLISCKTDKAQFNITTHVDFSTYVDRDTILLREASQSEAVMSAKINDIPFGPVFFTIQGLRLDALNAVFADPVSTRDLANLRHWDITFEQCQGDENSRAACQQARPRWNSRYRASWINGTTGEDQGWENPTALAVIRNLVNVFSAAIHVDLGHATRNNLFTNQTLLQSTLNLTYQANEALPPQNAQTRKVTATLNYTSPFAQALYANPQSLLIQLPLQQIDQTEIACSFLCQKWVLKSPGSLIASVFAATFSIVLATWRGYITFFGLVARDASPGGNHCSCRQCNLFPGEADHVPLFDEPESPWHPDQKGSYKYKEPM